MRVSPQNNQTFTSSKGYTITNPTINFEDSSKIRKLQKKPIGVDESFYAIRFVNLDHKSHYWFFPDESNRDKEYDILDAITDFGSNSNGNSDYANVSNQAIRIKQEELKTIGLIVDLANDIGGLFDSFPFSLNNAQIDLKDNDFTSLFLDDVLGEFTTVNQLVDQLNLHQDAFVFQVYNESTSQILVLSGELDVSELLRLTLYETDEPFEYEIFTPTNQQAISNTDQILLETIRNGTKIEALKRTFAQYMDINVSIQVIEYNSKSPSNITTPINVKQFHVLFLGTGGTIAGVSMANKQQTPPFGNGRDTIRNPIPLTLPTTGQKRIVIFITA